MTETEATLVIVSEQPEELLSEIERITTIGPYKLGPSRVLKFEDRYFDTIDGALARNRWALRLRNVGSENRIALKGPSLNKDWEAVERLEIDLPWDSDSAAKVFSEIARRQLGVTFPRDYGFSADPMKSLRSLGLQVIQYRKTTRGLKDVLIEKERHLVGELALDSVVYSLAYGEVSHFEVEIEAKDIDNWDAIKMVLEFLTRRHGSELVPWPHSKLATGEALEIVEQQMRLKDSLQGRRLTRGDYEMISECINDQQRLG